MKKGDAIIFDSETLSEPGSLGFVPNEFHLDGSNCFFQLVVNKSTIFTYCIVLRPNIRPLNPLITSRYYRSRPQYMPRKYIFITPAIGIQIFAFNEPDIEF